MKPQSLVKVLGIVAMILALGRAPSAANAQEPAVPYVESVGDGFDFTSGNWKKALLIDRFLAPGAFNIMGKAFADESAVTTQVYLLRTAEALHFGIVCSDSDGLERKGGGKRSEAPFPGGNTLEIFIDGDLTHQQAFYQFVVNPAGDRWFSAAGEERSSERIACHVQQGSDAWRIKLRIPYDAIGIKEDTDEVLINFFRNYRPTSEGEPASLSTWEGSAIASFNQLRPLKLLPAETP